MPIIRLEPHRDGFAANPAEYLGGEFSSYIECCRRVGLRYDKEHKRNFGGLGLMPALIAELERNGFAVAPDATLRATVDAQGQALREARAQADAVVARAEALAVAAGKSLFPFQVQGILWLAMRKRGLLADEMGLGKTWQAALRFDERAAILVICPGLAKGNWCSELRRLQPGLRVTRMDGRGSFRWPEAGEAVVINYDLLPPVVEEIRQKKDETDADFQARRAAVPPLPALAWPVEMVVDEAHRVKNRKALRNIRTRALKVRACEMGGGIIPMSGSPLLNRPDELWNVLDVADLAVDAFGSFREFCRLFDRKRGKNGWEWGTPSPEVPGRLRKVMLRRRRADVLPQLPVKTHQTIEVELDDATRSMCDEVQRFLEGRGIKLADIGTTIDESRLRGPEFETLAKVRSVLAMAMIPAALEQVEEYEEQGEPALVFSWHRAPVEIIGKRPGWGLITGDTPNARRDELVAAMQAGALKGLAGTISAMGEAITATRAAHGLFVDIAWTPGLNSQAEDRMVRIGQTRGVLIKRLIADHPVIHRVFDVVTQKQALIEASVEAASVPVALDGAAMANAETAARVAALSSVFDSAAVVDETVLAQGAQEGLGRTQAGPGMNGRVRYSAHTPAHHAAMAAVPGGFGADAVRHYQGLTELNDLEWAVLERIAEMT